MQAPCETGKPDRPGHLHAKEGCMMGLICLKCGNKIDTGELHQCMGPSLHAPWLQAEMERQTGELVKIRELLEAAYKRATENPEVKIRATKRETR